MASSAEPLASPPDSATHDGSFPGWWVVAGCFVVLTVSSGLGFYGLSVYLNAFSNERGWPLSSISLATTVFFVVGGFAGVAVARVIARHDVRLVIVVGGIVGGVALGVLGRVEQQWQLFVIILFGARFGNVLMLQPLLIAERFGVRDYPRIFSRTQLYAVIGTAGGPVLLGAVALALAGPATVEPAQAGQASTRMS